MTKKVFVQYEDENRSSRSLIELYRKKIEEENSIQMLELVHCRGGQEEFELAVEYSHGTDPLDRETGACILGQLGWERKTFLRESVDLLLTMLDDEDDGVITSAATALGHRSDPRAISKLLQLVDHKNEDVRYAVVFGLSTHEDFRAVKGLITLSKDSDTDIRNWAVFGLGSQIDMDTKGIRDALFDALKDSDQEVRDEALTGLAERGDPRVVDAILQEWEQDSISKLSLEAARIVKDPRFLDNLYSFLETMDFESEDEENYGEYDFEVLINEAIEACEE